MAEVKWIKIVTDVFDDEKIRLIESMPEADSIIVIWFKLLCLAGSQNNNGVIMVNGKIPYTEEMLSAIFRRPLNTIRLALQTFTLYEMVKIIDNVITIPNWNKHQNLDKLDKKTEYQKVYMREYRQKQREIALTSANSKANSKSNGKYGVSALDIDKEIDINNPPTPLRGERENTGFSETEVLSQSKAGAALKAKLGEWLTYKRERRQAYKAQGLRAFLATAEKYAERYGEGAVAELIDASMANGYQGVVWDRLKRAGGAQPEYEELT